jgi:hypothetical protein
MRIVGIYHQHDLYFTLRTLLISQLEKEATYAGSVFLDLMVGSMVIYCLPLPETILAHIKVRTFLTFVSKSLDVSDFTNAALNSMRYIFYRGHRM